MKPKIVAAIADPTLDVPFVLRMSYEDLWDITFRVVEYQRSRLVLLLNPRYNSYPRQLNLTLQSPTHQFQTTWRSPPLRISQPDLRTCSRYQSQNVIHDPDPDNPFHLREGGISYEITLYPLPLLLVNKQVLLEAGLLLVGTYKLLREAIPKERIPKITKSPMPRFVSLCQKSTDFEILCDRGMLEQFLGSLSLQVLTKIQSVIINELDLMHHCKNEEEEGDCLFEYLARELPQLKKVDVASQYKITEQITDKAIKSIFRLLENGRIDVVRLYVRWHDWQRQKTLHYMDPPSETRIHAILEDLGLDTQELEPGSYVEVLRGGDNHRDLQYEGASMFYSGTATYLRGVRGKPIKLVRAYHTLKTTTKTGPTPDVTSWGSESGEVLG